MKRISGSEAYYLFDNAKSLRENLHGRAIVEYPEFILVPPQQWQHFHQNLTTQLDYIPGQRPIRPNGNNSTQKREKPKKSELDERKKQYNWDNKKIKLNNVELEPWIQEALSTKGSKPKNNKR